MCNLVFGLEKEFSSIAEFESEYSKSKGPTKKGPTPLYNNQKKGLGYCGEEMGSNKLKFVAERKMEVVRPFDSSNKVIEAISKAMFDNDSGDDNDLLTLD